MPLRRALRPRVGPGQSRLIALGSPLACLGQPRRSPPPSGPTPHALPLTLPLAQWRTLAPRRAPRPRRRARPHPRPLTPLRRQWTPLARWRWLAPMGTPRPRARPHLRLPRLGDSSSTPGPSRGHTPSRSNSRGLLGSPARRVRRRPALPSSVQSLLSSPPYPRPWPFRPAPCGPSWGSHLGRRPPRIGFS